MLLVETHDKKTFRSLKWHGWKNQSAEGELDKLKTLMSPRDHGNARDTSIVLMFKVIHTFDDSFTHNSNDTFLRLSRL